MSQLRHRVQQYSPERILRSDSSSFGRCDRVEYKVIGGDMQIVEIELDPGKRSSPKPGP